MISHARNLTLVLAVGLSIFFGCLNHKQAVEVIEARAQVQLEIKRSKAAEARAELAEIAAARHVAKKDTIVIRAQAHAAKGDYKQAYEEQKKATAELEAAVDTLAPALKDARSQLRNLGDASQGLVNKTKPSFWKSLTPKFGVQATVGIDPLKPQDGVKHIVGIGAQWSF